MTSPDLYFGNQAISSERCIFRPHYFVFLQNYLMKLYFNQMLSTCLEVYHQESYETSYLLYFTDRMLLRTLFSIFSSFIKTHVIHFFLDLLPKKTCLSWKFSFIILLWALWLLSLYFLLCFCYCVGLRQICGSFLSIVRRLLHKLCTLTLLIVLYVSCIMFSFMICLKLFFSNHRIIANWTDLDRER